MMTAERLRKVCAAGFAALVMLASCATPPTRSKPAQVVEQVQPVATPVAASKPVDLYPAGWANDRSDLPKDPDYTLGVLPNGMRYLILPNHNPPNQVAMRLVISAGSMQERPGEEG